MYIQQNNGTYMQQVHIYNSHQQYLIDNYTYVTGFGKNPVTYKESKLMQATS